MTPSIFILTIMTILTTLTTYQLVTSMRQQGYTQS